MQLLLMVAIGCCAVLLAGIFGLWWKLRQMRTASVRALQSDAGNSDVTQRKPPRSERRQHPRMDLAAGSAPAYQSVRERQRGQGLQRQGDGLSGERSIQGRPDRAYGVPAYGDLRDPDIGQAPAGGVLRPTGSLGKRER